MQQDDIDTHTYLGIYRSAYEAESVFVRHLHNLIMTGQHVR